MDNDNEEEIEQFKRGIFALRTNFGELAQLMIKKEMHLLPSDDNSYDLKDSGGQKIEVKFSRAYKREVSITEENAIELCTKCSNLVYRADEAEKKDSNYDCNIQQIKPRCFDSLYYGVFFADKIEVFCISQSEFPKHIKISKKKKESVRKRVPGYSLQHKGGKECQFHITKSTHQLHYKLYHVKDITYEELYGLFKTQK